MSHTKTPAEPASGRAAMPGVISRRRLIQAVAGSAVLGLPAVGGLSLMGAAAGCERKRNDLLHWSSYEAAFNAFYDWHCRIFFNFERHLHAAERRYIRQCYSLADAWDYRINETFAFSFATISYRVKGTSLNATRIYAGSIKYRDRIQDSIRALLRLNRMPAQQVNTLPLASALGWDLAKQQIKVYFNFIGAEQIWDPEIRALYDKASALPIYDEWIASYTVRNGEVIEKKAYVAARHPTPPPVDSYPFADNVKHTILMITDKRGFVPQVDLKRPLDDTALNETGRRICRLYASRFHETLDTLAWQNPESYALYFP